MCTKPGLAWYWSHSQRVSEGKISLIWYPDSWSDESLTLRTCTLPVSPREGCEVYLLQAGMVLSMPYALDPEKQLSITVCAKDAVAIHIVCWCQVVGSLAHPSVVQLPCSVFVLGVGLDGSESVMFGVRSDMAHLAWSGMPCTQLATGGRLFAVMPLLNVH